VRFALGEGQETVMQTENAKLRERVAA